MKTVTILGSTGSIGVQSLDVVRRQGYKVYGLAAYSNIELLKKQVEEFCPEAVAVVEERAAEKFSCLLNGFSPKPQLLRGEAGLLKLAGHPKAGIVLNAVVGIAGLGGTLAAIEAGHDVALANKESLVTGGKLVTEAVRRKGVKLLPVDSEHSAIFQCLQDAHSAKTLEKILLTASGGSFFGMKAEELKKITPKEALRHPNWNMGAKITVDSATLMNKGLELIEAVWLFDLPSEAVEIVVQRQSIIHSMVQFSDHSVLAQLGVPDMRLPIQYALTWPERCAGDIPELDFKTLRSITFDQPDEVTFRCLAACKKAIKKGGLAPCAANGANEQAVALFLENKIGFLQIGELVEQAVEKLNIPQGAYSLADVYAVDKAARAFVMAHI